MDYTPWVQRFEVVYGLDIAASGSGLTLCRKQKSVWGMIDLVASFCGPEDVVVSFCAGKLAVEKTRLVGLRITTLWNAKKMKVV